MDEMENNLTRWRGEFGKKYTERNDLDWRRRLSPFKEIISDLNVDSVLEVGCNRAYNLLALREVLGEEAGLVGVEPNRYAVELARKSSSSVRVVEGNAYNLPFRDNLFDLCLTCGVLIHIPPKDINNAIQEVYRVCSSYLLSIEYYSEGREEVTYRGEEGMLWKRDFLSLYEAEFQDLSLVRKGYLGPEDGFDRCRWWLMET